MCGIVNSLVLVDFFTHELRPKVKTYHCEVNTNQSKTTFPIATHLNLRYFLEIVSGSSVIDGNGLSIVVKLCRWIFVIYIECGILSRIKIIPSSCRKCSKNQLSKGFSYLIVAYWQIKL